MKFDEYFKLKELTLNITNYCNMADKQGSFCSYCVSGDTMITMSDLTQKSIKDIHIGDEILSIEENMFNGKPRKLKTSKVTKVFSPRYIDKIYHIKTEYGNELYISKEHLIYDSNHYKFNTVENMFNCRNKEKLLKKIDLPNYTNCNINSKEYKLGYFVSCWLGDGSYKVYKVKEHKTKKEYDGYRIRFVVKDDDINKRLKNIMNDFNIKYNQRSFCISKKYNILREGIFSNTRSVYNTINNLIEENLNKNNNEDYLRGFLAGIYDCEGSCEQKCNTIRISNTDIKILQQIEYALKKFNIDYVLEDYDRGVNFKVYSIRIKSNSRNKFLELTYPACRYKRINYENKCSYSNDKITLFEEIEFNNYVYNIETSEHTYIANNVIVHNCFENNRSKKMMSKEQFKEIIDKCYLNHINNYPNEPFYVSFFGGEPFVNWELIEYALKYSKEQNYNIEYGVTTNLIELTDHMIDVIEEYELGLLVSIDGVKEIHDRNRAGSYNLVKSNVERLIDRGLKYLIEVRMTVMPNDVDKLLESIQSIVDMGIVNIAPVPVSDTDWTEDDIINLKNNLSKVWEWLINIYNDNENKKNISIKFIEDYIENVLIFPLEEQMRTCLAGQPSNCSIGVDGEIMPCHQRHTIKNNKEEISFGNFFKDDIKKINFNQNRTKGFYDCQKCLAYNVCKGGCPSENLTQNKDSNIMNKNQCDLTIALMEVALKYQYKLMNTKNIRSHRLNVLKCNMELLNKLITEVLTKQFNTEEYNLSLLDFYEKLIDYKGILLPSFEEVINNIIEKLIDINNELKKENDND